MPVSMNVPRQFLACPLTVTTPWIDRGHERGGESGGSGDTGGSGGGEAAQSVHAEHEFQLHLLGLVLVVHHLSHVAGGRVGGGDDCGGGGAGIRRGELVESLP
eukprot:6528544-Prymnesium_polylepis.1